MSSEQMASESVSLQVENIGGISEADVTFEPGVTILTGRNATNRTSLLKAITLALGSEQASLKADAQMGSVEMEFGGKTYTRTIERTAGGVTLDGDPYLEDPEVADLFAFLLEDNEARQAIAGGENLREIIMRPVDTEAIQAEISELERRRDDLDERLESMERAERRLPDLEERKADVESEIEEKRTELASVESEIESLDDTVEETHEEKRAFESKLDELREARTELERVRQRIETETGSIESLKDEREEAESELESFGPETTEDPQSIERDIEKLRERRRNLDNVAGEIQNVIQFNEEMLADDRPEIRRAVEGDDDGDDRGLDRLVESATTCWTCGSEIEEGQVEAVLARLRELRSAKMESLRATERELEERKSDLDSIEEARNRRDRLEERFEDVTDELEERTTRKERLEEERADLEERLEDLEVTIDEFESEKFRDILDKHKQANQLEFEIDQLRDDLDSVVEEIETLEDTLTERDGIEEERSSVQSALVDARTRIERIEKRAIEQFNEQIETVLDILEYDNLDRIWIERVERDVRDGRQTVQRSQFELHVVRTNDEGVAFEDTVDHLSESEREVLGLVFALAGYLVHDVHESLPFILLDSLEAIDSDRISALVEYFNSHAEYSVIALLPEDEQALDESHQRVTSI